MNCACYCSHKQVTGEGVNYHDTDTINKANTKFRTDQVCAVATLVCVAPLVSSEHIQLLYTTAATY
jgi:hypothetical protein